MPEPTAVNSMFARIARRYDLANRLLSGGLDMWWRWRLVRNMRACTPTDILDLATGSGDVAFSISRNIPSANRIVGMDFCQPMLDEAIDKQADDSKKRYGNISFRQGDGLDLPLQDNEFDAVAISFGLRNMGDRHRSLTEMKRVLRPGGRLFVLEFSQPICWFRPIYLFYLRHILPWLAGILSGDRTAYVYLNETIEAFPNRDALSAEFLAAGFNRVQAQGWTFGVVALHTAVK
jgi:demethylmenaquinone methyltransferase/2-methoxy-6-polyprenyl-1,4-benzoquinol methylase